jgi:hypothetical protein
MTIFIVSFATGMTVFTLNIHHKGQRGREVPHIIKVICFRFLAKLFRMHIDTTTVESQASAAVVSKDFRQNVFNLAPFVC